MADCLERPKCRLLDGGNYSPDYYLCPLPPSDWVPASQLPVYPASPNFLRDTYFIPGADANMKALMAKTQGTEFCFLGLWGCVQTSTVQQAQEELVSLMDLVHWFMGRQVEYNTEMRCPLLINVFTKEDVALAARLIDSSRDKSRDWCDGKEWCPQLPHYTVSEISRAQNKLCLMMESANLLFGTTDFRATKTCYWDHCAKIFLCDEKHVSSWTVSR